MPPTLPTTMRSKSCGFVDAAHRAQRQLACALIHAAARDFHVLRCQRGADLLDIQVVRVELLAVEPDLNLALRVRQRSEPDRRRASDSMFFLILSSTIFVVSRRSRGDETATLRIGDASVATFSITGGSASWGSRGRMRLILSRISCAPTSGSLSSMN